MYSRGENASSWKKSVLERILFSIYVQANLFAGLAPLAEKDKSSAIEKGSLSLTLDS